MGILALLLPSLAQAEVPYVPPQAYPVRVHLLGDRRDFKLELTGSSGGLLCVEPCDRELQLKAYQRFLIAPGDASGAVQVGYQEIPPFALPPEHPEVWIRVDSGKPERRIAGAFVLGTGLVVAGLGLLTGLGGEVAVLASGDGDLSGARAVRNVGGAIAIAGAVVGLAGLFTILLSPPPHATISPNPGD